LGRIVDTEPGVLALDARRTRRLEAAPDLAQAAWVASLLALGDSPSLPHGAVLVGVCGREILDHWDPRSDIEESGLRSIGLESEPHKFDERTRYKLVGM